MSEEILRALMQLFAIIAKQDDGSGDSERNFVRSFLSFQLNKTKSEEYLALYDNYLTEDKVVKGIEGDDEVPTTKKRKRTSVSDSVRTLTICIKINKTLAQKQKVIVLVRLYELLKANNSFTESRIDIINTAAEGFNISEEEKRVAEVFFTQVAIPDDIAQHFVVINDFAGQASKANHIRSEGLDGEIVTIRFPSVNLLFTNYTGINELQINGIPVDRKIVYLLAPGSTIRVPRGTIYYSDIVEQFLSTNEHNKISFVVENLQYKFPGGKIGLRDINFSESHSALVGIMGASGAGKTTLLNVLSGIEKPSGGNIRINGQDVTYDKSQIKGLIGYISQDDLLIEELTVYQNLYINAQLCFKDKSPEELKTVVLKTLEDLGLLETKDIIVGNALNKKISGGQRKRLNIALDLIREPAILFVDEPTSGLSSRDSENVMDLLKELSLKGNLIFVVIHQPSSDIFKMFDKICVLDVGGYNIYYGNPVEAVMYFKKAANHVNCDIGECELCGNVNPELIFNILESQEVDEYGNYTGNRKVQPEEWHSAFKANIKLPDFKEVKEKIVNSFKIPGVIKQLFVFIKRDILSKIGNKQYLLINLIEAPALAMLLSFVIRYTSRVKGAEYVFRDNDNIPAYIFMCVIVMLFIGLTVSAEEIYKDRKILKRERFLNLSPFAYYLSKVKILFVITAIQSLLFVLIGNYIIELKGMTMQCWFMLFTVGCCANVIGLNISSAFNSAVTIYILIPLLIIPQLILGGAMFTFDKLNASIGGGSGVPAIASTMPSRWAYEGLMVQQFRYNNYEEPFFEFDKSISQVNNKMTYYIPELVQIATDALRLSKEKDAKSQEEFKEKITIIKNELTREARTNKEVVFNDMAFLTPKKFTNITFENLNNHFVRLNRYYNFQFIRYDIKRNLKLSGFVDSKEGQERFQRVKNKYSNEYLEDVVRKEYVKNKYIIENGCLNQQLDPIYINPPKQYISYNIHFFSPYKYLLGKEISTFWFNTVVIWFISLILFILLYFEVLKKTLNLFNKH
ncbi:MAG: ATP-binding cassette domain-containing protein [Bacteroidetes bacterium]|nr:ATP-binding cassette domain-containing protein [Bacteroidota bacterium]